MIENLPFKNVYKPLNGLTHKEVWGYCSYYCGSIEKLSEKCILLSIYLIEKKQAVSNPLRLVLWILVGSMNVTIH